MDLFRGADLRVRRAFASDQAGHAQNPAFNLRNSTLPRRWVGSQVRHKAAVAVGTREPGRNAVGVVLIRVPSLAGEGAAPKRRIHFCYSRASSRDVPAVERPEMHTLPKLLPDEAQPRNPGMGGF